MPTSPHHPRLASPLLAALIVLTACSAAKAEPAPVTTPVAPDVAAACARIRAYPDASDWWKANSINIDHVNAAAIEAECGDVHDRTTEEIVAQNEFEGRLGECVLEGKTNGDCNLFDPQP